MFDAAIFIVAWLAIGVIVYAVMHALLNDKMDDDNLELILGAVFWPVLVFSPIAAVLYVLICSAREKISDRLAKRRA